MSDDLADARIALLNDEGVTVPHVRAALASLGVPVVHEATCADFDRAALDASSANVVIVNLGATASDIDDGIYDLLADARYRVIFNEADVSGALSGWDQTRWARHLAAKIAGDGDIDPPRPANAEAVPELRERAKDRAVADIGAAHAPVADDGVAHLGGIDELLSHFDAAIGAAEQRERDASTASDVVEVAESAATPAAIDAQADASSGDDRGTQASEAPEWTQGFSLALADADAPIAALAKPAPETAPMALPRLSENWSLESIDDALAVQPISGKAAYTARDIASENERMAGSIAPLPAADTNAPLSPAETWLTSLQLAPMESDVVPRVASPSHEDAVLSADPTIAETARDHAGVDAIGALWMVVASSDAGHAVAEFLGALTNPVDALVVIADQRHGDAQDTPATWTRSTPIVLRTPRHGERVAIGDVVIAPTPAWLHIAADGRVAIEPADDSFPYRSALDRMLCAAADAFGSALSAIVLDGAPADVLLACHHVVECGGKVYAQDAATCSEPATSEAIASSTIAKAIAPVPQIAAMLVAESAR